MRTVLTMTTSPQRIQHLPKVLDSLFNQIAPPDSVYLNLPARYRNCETYTIPDWLNDWEVTVLRPSYDFGPVMKILPVLEVETDMETLLITMFDTRQIRFLHYKMHLMLTYHQPLVQGGLILQTIVHILNR